MVTLNQKSPVEVWLRKRNLAITCMVVFEDESTDEFEVRSLSMRGAQREVTGDLIGQGYQPVGRWEAADLLASLGRQAGLEEDPETVRRFKLKPTVAEVLIKSALGPKAST